MSEFSGVYKLNNVNNICVKQGKYIAEVPQTRFPPPVCCLMHIYNFPLIPCNIFLHTGTPNSCIPLPLRPHPTNRLPSMKPGLQMLRNDGGEWNGFDGGC